MIADGESESRIECRIDRKDSGDRFCGFANGDRVGYKNADRNFGIRKEATQ